MKGATAETTTYDGCLVDDGRQIGYCATCEIRPCGVERSVLNCTRCPEYACEKLESFFAHAQEARPTLDEIRASL